MRLLAPLLLAAALAGGCAPPAGPVVVPVHTPAPVVVPVRRPAPHWSVRLGWPFGPRWRYESRVPAGEPEPAVDLLALPASVRKRNIESRGLGCCVFRSLSYAAGWQNEPALADFPEWMVSKNVPGGGIPSKVDALIPRIAADRGLPAPRYVQYEGNDPALIELALKTGRLPCVTWNGNHMLCCVHLDAERAAILDNNAPERVQWMSRDVFLRKYAQGGGGWTVVLLAPAPPPPPLGARPPATRVAVGTADDDGPLARLADGLLYWKRELLPGWSVCGRPVTRREAEDALADDSARPHLTLVGAAAETAALLAAVPDPARYRVQRYAPDAWELGCGFRAPAPGAGPTAYLQEPGGRVLFRRDGATPAELASALRRADPNYDPAKDPDGRPAALPGLDPAQLKKWAQDNRQTLLLGAGALAAWLLLRRPPAPQAQQTPVVVMHQAPAPQPAPAPRAAEPTARELAAEIVAQLKQSRPPEVK